MALDPSLISRLEDNGKPLVLITEGLFLFANKAFLDTFCYHTLEALSENTLLDLLVDLDKKQLKAFLKAGEATEKTEATTCSAAKITTSILAGDYRRVSCEILGKTIEHNNHKYLCLEVECAETTSTEQKLKEIHNAEDPIAIVDEGFVVYANSSFDALTGSHLAERSGPMELLDLLIHVKEKKLIQFLSQSALAKEGGEKKPKLPIIIKSQKKSSYCLVGQPINFQGKPCVCLRIEQRKPSQSQSGQVRQKTNLILCVSVLFALLVFPAFFLPRLEINNSLELYLPKYAPASLKHAEIREYFPSDQGLILLFEGVALFSAEFLTAIDGLTRDLTANPKIQKVVSVTSQDHIRGTSDGFMIEPLIDVESLKDSAPEQLKAKMVQDRFAYKLLVSEHLDALAIVVLPYSIQNTSANIEIQDEILELVEEHGLALNLTAIAGEIATEIELAKTTITENLLFVPATVVVGLILVWAMFRRPIAIVLTGLTLSVVINPTIAMYVIFDQPFNMISSIQAPLLSALTIAALVHIFNAIKNKSNRGLTGRQRVLSALEEVRKPALFAALTTIAGFMSLGLSSIPPIRSLGLISALGVGLIFIVVYQLLPILLISFDHSAWKKTKNNNVDRLVKVMFHFGVKKPLITVGFFCVIFVISVPYLNKIIVETNSVEYFSPDHHSRLATQHIDNKLSGTTPLEIIFTASEPEGIIVPETLEVMKGFQQWAESQHEIDRATSLVDFIEEMHWGFHGEKKGFRVIPKNGALIKQYLFIYDGNDLLDFVDADYQIARVVLNVNTHSASQVEALINGIKQHLSAIPNKEFNWDISGSGRIFAEQVSLLVAGQIKSVLGALAIITVLMLVLWKSLRDAIICLIPNIAPVFFIFVAMGAAGIWLDMATAMIASVTVGIAIDDTIHIYHGFKRRVRNGINPVHAIARTYRQSGRAVMVTTIILCSQFLILGISKFVPIQSFGLLTSAGLIAALIIDLLLLPALLILVYKTGESPRSIKA